MQSHALGGRGRGGLAWHLLVCHLVHYSWQTLREELIETARALKQDRANCEKHPPQLFSVIKLKMVGGGSKPVQLRGGNHRIDKKKDG